MSDTDERRTPGSRLRALMGEGSLPVVAPGAFDGLSARLIELAGFRAVYASGGAIARAAGYPDIGLLDLGEVLDRIVKIVEATSLPVIADADTGFGGSANVQRTARMLMKAGVAAFHIEDQQFPKRCGALEGKSLVGVDEMCRKIRIARETADGSGVLVIARTDAVDTEDFDSAMRRALAYHEAGADVLYLESLESVEQVERVARELPGPKLIDMFWGGKTPFMTPSELARLGFSLMIVPNDLQRAAIRSMQKALSAIMRDGGTGSMADDMATMAEREEIVRTRAFLALDA
jgi:2-methylisocitrate lyase-like PEP mutase family enzyme